jgi:thioredoxin-related protein
MKIISLFGLLSFFISDAIAQENAAMVAHTPAPTAEEVLAPAFKQAAAEHKNIIVIFHASWCSWCKKMDASMNDPLIGKFFTDNYITVHLTVEESAKNKQLENAGAWELKKKYNGDKAGLPFWLIMDKNRNLIADSYIRPAGAPLSMPGKSIGCPANDDEVQAFIDALKKSSRLDDASLQLIATCFKKNKIS